MDYIPNRISVIVPIFNAEHYLHNCIESILSQTYADFELLLINDGSTDMSASICDGYRHNEKIRIISQANSGVTAARANGVRNSKGEFICFVDADDTIGPDLLESLMIRMNDDIDIVISESKINDVLSAVEYANCLFDFQYWPIWGKLFRKTLFDEYVYDIPRYFNIGEDFLTQLRLLRNLKRNVLRCKIFNYNYNRSNPNSITTTERIKSCNYERAMIEYVVEIINNCSYYIRNGVGRSLLSWQLKYLGGMIGLQYPISPSDIYVARIIEVQHRYVLSFRERMILKAIDIPCLRYGFVLEKFIKIRLRRLFRNSIIQKL